VKQDEKNIRRYRREECAVFLRTGELFGGLSNMCAGFPLSVEGVAIRTAEALYQACRFPLYEAVQAEIIAQRSPIAAKMKARKHQFATRSDWMMRRLRVMRWTLRVKLAQHFELFGGLLKSTGDKPIVEESSKGDDYWGAIAQEDDKDLLVGVNALGRLLMELRRDFLEKGEAMKVVSPPEMDNFLLMGKKIGEIRT
jgi:ribA/ribD-fused uncharacterized protein